MCDLVKDYADALRFWNAGYVPGDKRQEKYDALLTPGADAGVLAASSKLASIIRETLKTQNRVLDYGCGEGWAGMLLCQAGCPQVTCADLSENAILLAREVQRRLHIGDKVHCIAVEENYLSSLPEHCFDGIVCSNVLDVVPQSVAEGILAQFARLLSPEGKIVIGLNYHAPTVPVPEKNITIKHQNHLYINNILRLVSLSDEEWHSLLSRYFTVESLGHFGWNGESTERRRVFVLRPRA